MKLGITSLKELSRCTSYSDHSLDIVVIWKTKNNNLIKMVTKSYNCNHVCEFYAFNRNDMTWKNIIDPIIEVSHYQIIQYHIKSSDKIAMYTRNEVLVIQHFLDIFGDVV